MRSESSAVAARAVVATHPIDHRFAASDLPPVRYCATRDVSLRYLVLGEGRPIMLLHGFSDSLESWIEIGYARRLVQAGFQVILPDSRGHGGSGKPPHPASYAAPRRAADIVTLMDCLGLHRVDLLGFSLGGRTALEALAFHPDRVGSVVALGAHPFSQSMGLMRAAVAEGLAPWIAMLQAQASTIPQHWLDRLRQNDVAALRALVAEDRSDLTPAIAGLGGRCLFIVGDDDPVAGPLRRVPDVMAGASVVRLQGCNHVGSLLARDLVLGSVLPWLLDGEAGLAPAA